MALNAYRKPLKLVSDGEAGDGCGCGNHGASRPQKPLRLFRDGEVGGWGIFISNTYSLHCYHQNDSALR